VTERPAARRPRLGTRLNVSRILDFIVVPGVLLGLALAYLYVPSERTMGDVQRIFYFHVPFAMSAFLAFGVVLISSLGYLSTRDRAWDRWAQAGAEVGFLCCTIVLLTGPVWARSAWGVWWTWDARLSTTLLLWLIYAAYLMLRSYGDGGDRTLRQAAVLGIAGALNVPIVYYSVAWFRTQHPQATFFTREGLPVPEMAIALRFCLAVVILLVVDLIWKRVWLAHLEERRDRLRLELEEARA